MFTYNIYNIYLKSNLSSCGAFAVERLSLYQATSQKHCR